MNSVHMISGLLLSFVYDMNSAYNFWPLTQFCVGTECWLLHK